MASGWGLGLGLRLGVGLPGMYEVPLSPYPYPYRYPYPYPYPLYRYPLLRRSVGRVPRRASRRAACSIAWGTPPRCASRCDEM